MRAPFRISSLGLGHSSFGFRHLKFSDRMTQEASAHSRLALTGCNSIGWFTFSDARAIVPYLHALGVSDVYASPYFQASPDSLHGYDITDHNKLNTAIGSRADYDAWIAELHAHGMGQVLDFVPNHVGIADSRNQWWMDVLENGPQLQVRAVFRHRLGTAEI